MGTNTKYAIGTTRSIHCFQLLFSHHSSEWNFTPLNYWLQLGPATVSTHLSTMHTQHCWIMRVEAAFGCQRVCTCGRHGPRRDQSQLESEFSSSILHPTQRDALLVRSTYIRSS